MISRLPFVKSLLGCFFLCVSFAASSDDFSAGLHPPSDVFKDPRVVALLHAVEHQDAVAAKRLISSGADVNAVGVQAITPLSWLLDRRDNNAVELLLKLGADPNKITVLDNEIGAPQPMWAAAAAGQKEALQLMLDHGGNPNLVFGNNSLLMNAVQEGHLDCAELLLQRGADINHFEGPMNAFFVTMTRVQYGNALWVLEHGYTHDLPMARKETIRIAARPGQEAMRAQVLEIIDQMLAGHPVAGGTNCCVGMAASSSPPNIDIKSDETKPVKYIGVYISPYYQSAQSPEGHPIVAVSKDFDKQLASNKREDILAVRDAIQAKPQLVTPMTLMVLAIRLYDVGLRDDAVFWFYAAKNRYFAMSGVLDVKSPALAQLEDTVKNFAVLAGPFINSYAFCDSSKQRETSLKSIAWVEQNPYEAMFMEQLPAMPGDRVENLKKSIADIKARAQKEALFFDDPKNQEAFIRKRKDAHVPEQFCWVQGGNL